MDRSFACRFGMAEPHGAVAPWRVGLMRHLLRLDLKARISRFFGPAPDGMISDYVRDAKPLFVVTAEAGGEVCGVAEVHPHHEMRHAAEIAVSVDEDRRRQGVGWTLFSHAVEECKRRDIEDVWIVYLRGNEPMRRIGERAGFAKVAGGDPTTVTAHLIDLSSGRPDAGARLP